RRSPGEKLPAHGDAYRTHGKAVRGAAPGRRSESRACTPVKLVERWHNYWFGDGSYFDLALLRIGEVSLPSYRLLTNCFSRLLNVNALPDDMYRPIPMLQILMFPSGSTARPDPESMVILFWFVLAFGFTSLLGILTNVSLALFAIGYIFIQAYIYSFGDMHHPEAIMAIALLAIAFRSEERRVGKECRSGWLTYHENA